MFLHFGRSIPSIMGEDDAICAHVLRYALAIVGIFRCGPSTYSVRRSVIVQRSRGLRSGRCNGWPWLRSWPWRCRTRCRADGTCAALLPLWNTSTSWTNLPQWSLVNVQPIVLMRRRGRGEGLKRRRPSRAVVGRMWIRVGMGVRGRMRVGRVRRWWRRWPLVEVRIILIHHLGTAHHPARARHPRAGLSTCVPERRTTRSSTIFSFHFVHHSPPSLPPPPLSSPPPPFPPPPLPLSLPLSPSSPSSPLLFFSSPISSFLFASSLHEEECPITFSTIVNAILSNGFLINTL